MARVTHYRAFPKVARGDDLLKARPEAIEAWKDMRFGMFICWGPVFFDRKGDRLVAWQPRRPVKDYDGLYKKWNPDQVQRAGVGRGRQADQTPAMSSFC